MKSLIYVLALIAIPGFCFAQSDSVSFIAYWSKGESRTFEVTKTRVAFKGGVQTKNESSSHTSIITVLDSTQDAYVLEWKCENSVLTGKKFPVELSDLAAKYKYLTIKYKTTETGMFEEIINLDEITKVVAELFDVLSTKMKPEEAKVVNSILESFKSPASVDALLSQELKLIHWPMGAAFKLKDTLKYDDELPNMFGGDPIKARGRFLVDSVDDETGSSKLVNFLDIDQEDSKEAVTAVLTKVSSAMTFSSEAEKQKKIGEMKAFFDKMSMSISDRHDFDFNYIDGWPSTIVATRKIMMNSHEGEARQVDETRIKLVD